MIVIVLTTNIFKNIRSLSRYRLYIVAQRVTKYKESAVYDFREPRRQNPHPLENIIYFLAGAVYEGRLNCRLRGEQIYTAICYVGSFHKSAPFPPPPAHGQTINWVLGPVDNTGVTRHDRSPLCNPSLWIPQNSCLIPPEFVWKEEKYFWMLLNRKHINTNICWEWCKHVVT